MYIHTYIYIYINVRRCFPRPWDYGQKQRPSSSVALALRSLAAACGYGPGLPLWTSSAHGASLSGRAGCEKSEILRKCLSCGELNWEDV